MTNNFLVVNDDFMYIPNKRNNVGKNEKLSFFSGKLESYSAFKIANQKSNI